MLLPRFLCRAYSWHANGLGAVAVAAAAAGLGHSHVTSHGPSDTDSPGLSPSVTALSPNGLGLSSGSRCPAPGSEHRCPEPPGQMSLIL